MPKSKEFITSSESDSDASPPKVRCCVCALLSSAFLVLLQAKKRAVEKKSKPKPKPAASSNDQLEDGKLQLASKKYVSISEFRGKKYVDIREYYEKDGKSLPGKKGKNSVIICPFNTYNEEKYFRYSFGRSSLEHSQR